MEVVLCGGGRGGREHAVGVWRFEGDTAGAGHPVCQGRAWLGGAASGRRGDVVVGWKGVQAMTSVRELGMFRWQVRRKGGGRRRRWGIGASWVVLVLVPPMLPLWEVRRVRDRRDAQGEAEPDSREETEEIVYTPRE